MRLIQGAHQSHHIGSSEKKEVSSGGLEFILEKINFISCPKFRGGGKQSSERQRRPRIWMQVSLGH